MVQVLQAPPIKERRKSFSERLNEGVAGGLDIAQSFMLQNEKRKEGEALRQKAQELTGKDFSGVPADVIKDSFIDMLKMNESKNKKSDLLKRRQEILGTSTQTPEREDFQNPNINIKDNQLMPENLQEQIANKKFDYRNVTDDQIHQLFEEGDEEGAEYLFNSREKSLENERKQNKLFKEEKEEKETKSNLQNSFNGIVNLISKVGRGSGIGSLFGGKAAKNVGEFQALTGALEGALVKEVNKGALSNERFKYITEYLLPKHTDTQEKIKGKMRGLATILGLDATSLSGETQESDSSGRPSLESFKG